MLTTCGAGYATDSVIVGDSLYDYPTNLSSYLCRYLDTLMYDQNYNYSNNISSYLCKYLDTLLYDSNYNCSNHIDGCCSTIHSDTSKYIDTKDNDSFLGSRVVVPSSDISVAISPVLCDSDIYIDVSIQWAPSDVDDEYNTTRRGTHRPSILSNISHEVFHT